ncbi:MAG: ABC transporter permease [Candidatus Natronoplasma sp.]
MDFKTTWMELRKGWKGYTIFILIVVLISAGMAQLYPVVNETFEEDAGQLEGEEHVSLKILVKEDALYLEWDEVENAEEYIVLEDTGAHMATSWKIGNTTENNMTISRENASEDRYFGVVAVVGDSQIPVGIASTVESKTPFEEMMETPYFRMFTAGREEIRMDEIEGYLSVELYSWWILLAGVYLSYLSVKSITGDYEESRMDIIFSTPLTRKNYLLQKFLALALFSLLLVKLAGAALTLSVYLVGEGLMFDTFFISLLISWPMLLVIIAMSMFFAVLFRDSRTSISASFAVILVNYALFMAGHMLEELRFVLPFTISHYWDYNSVLLEGTVHPLHLLGLGIASVVVVAGSLRLFERSDIPV